MDRKISKSEFAAEIIRQAADKWPTSFVPRSQVGKFTGGLVAPGTCANMDCLGKGIPGAFKIGRQTCYPVEAITNWLIGRLEI